MLADEIRQANAEKQVEVVVIDNASSDGTDLILSNFISENPGLKIICKRNSKNLGVDLNCHIAVHTGSGEFCWLFCDDDRLENGALKIILDSCINNSSVAFVYVDYKVETGNQKHSSRCTVSGVQVIDGDSFFEITMLASSFASSCIFKNDRLNFEKYKKYVGTKWYHLFVTRDCINNDNVLIVGLPLITQSSPSLKHSRTEKKRTDDSGLEFYISAHLNICSFVKQLQHTVYCSTNKKWKNLMSVVIGENIYQIVNYKLTSNIYSFQEIFYISKKMSLIFPTRIGWWIFELPLLLSPNIVFRRVYTTFRYFKEKLNRKKIDA